MGFFKNLFSGKNEKIEENKKNTTRNISNITLTRSDGTSFIIAQRFRNGNMPSYKTVVDAYSGEIKYIPEYVIIDEVLRDSSRGNDMAEILIDIDYTKLENDEYRNIVANVLLSQRRLVQVVEQDYGYAGAIRTNRTGEFVPTRNSGILPYLGASIEEKQAMYNKAMSKCRENMGNVVQLNTPDIMPPR